MAICWKKWDIRRVFIYKDELELIVVKFNSILWPLHMNLTDEVNLKNMPANTKTVLWYKSNVMEYLLVTVTLAGVLPKLLEKFGEKKALREQ